MESEREPEREEVYERIPWETLEKSGGDRQWIVYAVAGAVVLGALAYSFTRNQPRAVPQAATVTSTVSVTSTVPVTSTTPFAPTAPATTIASNMDSPPSTVASPVVVAEADLYAVDPERLVDEARAHAEWFALEYMSVDGTEESRNVLRALLPEGIPMPVAPEDTQVFVDWVGATHVAQTGSGTFDVEVRVRSLVSQGEEGFTRRPPESLVVPVSVDGDGRPVVTGAPWLQAVSFATPDPVTLRDVPPDVAKSVSAGELIGGVPSEAGQWLLVVMVEDSAGIKRPAVVRP